LANLNEICKETAIKRRDLEKYITILEKTFILNLVKPFHMNRQKELTKMPKIFFSDTGLRNLNINDMRSLNIRPDKGALAENVFHQELIKQKATLEEVYFWRTKEKLEVDFIIVENRQLIPTEVKYQTMRSQDMPGPLRSFILKYRPKKAVVITKDYLSRTKLQRTEILFIPLWMT
jgi:predicted AAA+ superfamily ATPase